MRIILNRTSSLFFVADEERRIVEAIYDNDANILKTAHELGISRNNLYLKIRKYKLWPIILHIRRKKRQRLDLSKKVCTI